MHIHDFTSMSASDRKELMDILKSSHSEVHWKEKRAQRKKRENEAVAKADKLEKFLNSLDFVNTPKNWRETRPNLNLVSMSCFETKTSEEEYKKASEQISDAFKVIEKIKKQHVIFILPKVA